MEEHSSSLSTAALTALLAVVGWVSADLWKRGHERRVVASALAGELGGYLENLDPSRTPTAYRDLGKTPRTQRVLQLAAFPKIPDSHPVFDKVADRIGLLPPDIALEISKFYNLITGFRLLVANLSSEQFLNADDAFHAGTLETIAAAIEKHEGAVKDLIQRLDQFATRNFLWVIPYRYISG